MSEQQLKDFAETAERRVAVPDLADLTSRGRDLRRVRMAAAAGALALVVGRRRRALLGDPRRPQRPSRGGPRPHAGVRGAQCPAGRAPAVGPGERYAVRPWNLDEHGVRARFIAPGRDWVWRGDGAVKMRSGTSCDLPRRPYAGVAVMTADRVPVRQCSEDARHDGPCRRTPWPRPARSRAIPGIRMVGGARGDRAVRLARGAPATGGAPAVPRGNDVILWGVIGGAGRRPERHRHGPLPGPGPRRLGRRRRRRAW